MKKVILLALLMPFPAFGQIIENFESQSVANWIQSTGGRWSADTVQSLSGSYSLHHIFDNPDSGNDRIGIRTSGFHPGDGNTTWSFLVRHGYDPSSLNCWSVFLMSDSDPATMGNGSTKGFAIGVNLSGSDDSLLLWKVNGSLMTPVVKCRINWQLDIGIEAAVKIMVDRATDGKWTVTVSKPDGTLIRQTSGSDSELFAPDWFGILYKYSSTKEKLLWIDDVAISGCFRPDTEAPVITSCKASDKNSADLIFNEQPSAGILDPGNFSVSAGEITISSIIKLSDLQYKVVFSEELKNRKEYKLVIGEICDLSGNCSENVAVNLMVTVSGMGDVIISEIMADPALPVSLPESEYIEITNRTSYPFVLNGWKLSTETQEYSFPDAEIMPNGILILCSEDDTSLFSKYGKVAGFSSFPALTDGGRIIFLSDASGSFIHGVEYSDKWYRDELKSGGGWSVEMIDTEYPFFSEGNWKASSSKSGGTPGRFNSVSRSNPDMSFKGILNVFPEDSITIHIRFAEPVPDFPDTMEILEIGDRVVEDVSVSDPLFRNFIIRLREPLSKKIYDLKLTGSLSDFAGNEADTRSFSFGITTPAFPGDVLFNEILFNPWPGDPDYLELYNCSEKIIDVSRLGIVTINDASADTSLPGFLWDEGRCLLPGEYFAITTDKYKVAARYFSSDSTHLYERESLPSMSDDKGHLVLYSRELEKIDELVYSDEMHYSLLENFEGISLEKINPEKKSMEVLSWHSASESSGWGTPGAPNSVFVEQPSEKDEVVFSSTKITPDNDGYEDFLTINLNPAGTGNVVSIMVFDEIGGLVKKLVSNLFAGAGAEILWDGTANDGSFVNTGIYIVFISIYDDTGKTKKWKKVCTVIR